MKAWLTELCPELTEWQVDLICESMEKKDAALKLALEALDQITDDVDGTGLNTRPSFDLSLEAIAAIKSCTENAKDLTHGDGHVKEVLRFTLEAINATLSGADYDNPNAPLMKARDRIKEVLK